MTECEHIALLISAAADGEATEAERAEIAAHTASCPSCRTMADLFAVMHEAANEDDTDLPAGLHERIMDAVHASAAHTEAAVAAGAGADTPVTDLADARRRRARRTALRTAAAAACLCIVAGAVFLTHAGTGSSASVDSLSEASTDTAAVITFYSAAAETDGAECAEEETAGQAGSSLMMTMAAPAAGTADEKSEENSSTADEAHADPELDLDAAGDSSEARAALAEQLAEIDAVACSVHVTAADGSTYDETLGETDTRIYLYTLFHTPLPDDSCVSYTLTLTRSDGSAQNVYLSRSGNGLSCSLTSPDGADSVPVDSYNALASLLAAAAENAGK